ncbi:MAG: FecR family protein [Neptuniibacter sp.]
MLSKIKAAILLFGGLVLCTTVWAESDIGKIKVLQGDVQIHRNSQVIDAELNVSVYASDLIETGKGSSVGLLFNDDSRISAGPHSRISLDQFSFDKKTHDGQFDVSIKKGTLSVISGKLTKKRPRALKVKTPAAILAVRGTEFSVSVDPITE